MRQASEKAREAEGWQELRDRLIRRRFALRQILAARSASAMAQREPAGAGVHDTKDTSFQDSLSALQDADTAREIAELRDIEAALLRMRSGRYGVCTNCCDPIPVERLQAYPTAKRCRTCQEYKEHRVANAR